MTRAPKRLVPHATVRVNVYAVIARAVEEGVAYGYRRAHKHTDTPGEDGIRGAIENAVMSQLCEVLQFEP